MIKDITRSNPVHIVLVKNNETIMSIASTNGIDGFMDIDEDRCINIASSYDESSNITTIRVEV